METTSREKTILDRIVAARRESIARRKGSLPDAALKFAVEKAEPPRDFRGALAREERRARWGGEGPARPRPGGAPRARDGYNVIAELKKASPSRGILRQEY